MFDARPEDSPEKADSVSAEDPDAETEETANDDAVSDNADTPETVSSEATESQTETPDEESSANEEVSDVEAGSEPADESVVKLAARRKWGFGSSSRAKADSSKDAPDGDQASENEAIEQAVDALVAHPIFEMATADGSDVEVGTGKKSGKGASADKKGARVSQEKKPFGAVVRDFFLSRGFSQALGVVGESLITAGVVVMLFLGWQLWINDVIVFNESNAVAEKNVAKWTTTKVSTPTASGSATAAPEDFGPAPAMAAVSENTVFGNLYIPRFGNDYIKVVANGVSPEGTLNRGYFGRYPDSQWPGEAGNFAVAVHRAGHGSPFRNAPQLRAGDAVVLQTKQGYYEYTVRNTEYVLPTAVEVVNAIPGGSTQGVAGQSILTITTCNPELGNNERLITYAVLTGWRPSDAGPPAEIAAMVSR